MTKLRPVITVLVGAVGFWLPVILLNAFGASSIWRLTVLPILCFLVTYRVVTGVGRRSDISRAAFMLIGVWLFASTAMMISASFAGGGFATGVADTFVVIVLGLLPPYTLVMSAYDGSVVALLLTTFLAVGLHFLIEPHHWIVPPHLRGPLSQWYERRTA
jgi:hypothetical protein